MHHTYRGTIIGMEAQKQRILAILRPLKGKKKAITAPALARESRIAERKVRDIISYLVAKEGSLIGSSVNDPYGFYMIKTFGEWRESIRQCNSRENSLGKRQLSLYLAGKGKFGKKSKVSLSLLLK